MKDTRWLLSAAPLLMLLAASVRSEQLVGGELKSKPFPGASGFQSPFSSELLISQKKSISSITPTLSTGSDSRQNLPTLTTLQPDLSTLYNAPGSDPSAFQKIKVGFSDPRLERGDHFKGN